MSRPTKKTYFARIEDSQECVSDIISRIRDHRQQMRYLGLTRRILRSWNAYYGFGPNADLDTSFISSAGASGEALKVSVNHYHNLATKTLTLITSNRPATQAIATNNDSESLGQAKFAESLNDYYDRSLDLTQIEQNAARDMILLGESWVVQDWEFGDGEVVMVDDNGNPVTNGDVRVYNLTPFDVAHQLRAANVDTLEWIVFRRKVSRWELAAQYPEMEDEIISFSQSSTEFNDLYNTDFEFMGRSVTGLIENEDMVYLWEFRHRNTRACPNGRLIKFLDSKTVLYDTVKRVEGHLEEKEIVDLDGKTDKVTNWVDSTYVDEGYPYHNELFAYSSAPERIIGTTFGTTPFFDLLSLQEGCDLVTSIMASSISAGGLQNIYVKNGEKVNAVQLTGGLNVVYYDEVKPEAQANLAIPAAVPQFQDRLRGYMQELVAQNEVTAGNPSAGMPAQGMALLRAEAVEFHSSLQKAYETLIERNRTGILKLLQIFGDTDRVATIAGKSNSWAKKDFNKQDIAGFTRFVVEPINPATKTLAGKIALAQPLLQGGSITPQQYMQIFTTGRIDPVTALSGATQAKIEREKELLQRGIGLPPFLRDANGAAKLDSSGLPMFDPRSANDPNFVRPMITDNFSAALPEYISVLSTPESRSDAKMVDAVTKVITYCMQLWEAQPPTLTAVSGGRAFIKPMPGANAEIPQPGTVDTSAPTSPATATPQDLSGVGEIKKAQPPELKIGDDSLNELNNSQKPLVNK